MKVIFLSDKHSHSYTHINSWRFTHKCIQSGGFGLPELGVASTLPQLLKIIITFRVWHKGHPTKFFCKISVQRSKYCLEFAIIWGRLKISNDSSDILHRKSSSETLAWVSGLPEGLGERRLFSPFLPKTPDTQQRSHEIWFENKKCE